MRSRRGGCGCRHRRRNLGDGAGAAGSGVAGASLAGGALVAAVSFSPQCFTSFLLSSGLSVGGSAQPSEWLGVAQRQEAQIQVEQRESWHLLRRSRLRSGTSWPHGPAKQPRCAMTLQEEPPARQNRGKTRDRKQNDRKHCFKWHRLARFSRPLDALAGAPVAGFELCRRARGATLSSPQAPAWRRTRRRHHRSRVLPGEGLVLMRIAASSCAISSPV